MCVTYPAVADGRSGVRKQKLVVIGAVEDGSGNILLAQRHDPDIPEAHLKWDFPGGTNEFGESLEETLAREVLEETGLRVAVNELMPRCFSTTWAHKDYDLHSLVFCYRCRVLGGELSLGDHKIADLKWVRPSEARGYELLPTTKEFIDEL